MRIQADLYMLLQGLPFHEKFPGVKLRRSKLYVT